MLWTHHRFIPQHNEISYFVLLFFLILWIIVFIFVDDWTMRFHKIAYSVFPQQQHLVQNPSLMYSWDTFSSSYIILHKFLFCFIFPIIAQSCSTVMYFCKSDFHFATLIQGSLEEEGERLWIVKFIEFACEVISLSSFLLNWPFSYFYDSPFPFATYFLFWLYFSSKFVNPGIVNQKKKRKSKACITVGAVGRPWRQQNFVVTF